MAQKEQPGVRYMEGLLNEVIQNVRRGIRTKDDLRECGCVICMKALDVLDLNIS